MLNLQRGRIATRQALWVHGKLLCAGTKRNGQKHFTTSFGESATVLKEWPSQHGCQWQTLDGGTKGHVCFRGSQIPLLPALRGHAEESALAGCLERSHCPTEKAASQAPEDNTRVNYLFKCRENHWFHANLSSFFYARALKAKH